MLMHIDVWEIDLYNLDIPVLRLYISLIKALI